MSLKLSWSDLAGNCLVITAEYLLQLSGFKILPIIANGRVTFFWLI